MDPAVRRKIAGTGFSLRPPATEDVDALLPIKNNQVAAALLAGTPRPWSRADLANWVAHHRDAPDESFFLIVDAEDRPVGHAALYRIDGQARRAEFGILLGDPAVWGHGLGTAVTRAVVEHGFTALGLNRIYLEVLVTNERARHVYEKLGFRVEGRLRQHQLREGIPVDVLVMGLLREEYVGNAPEASST